MIVVYPGTFDPITNGHIDIIKRCSDQFDQVVVGILVNQNKQTLFSLQERVEMVEESLEELPNVSVKAFEGLLVDFCKANGSKTIIKGLRAIADYEYELQMATVNRMLSHDIETYFLQSRGELEYLSSSIVREIASYGGDLDGFVPQSVKERLLAKFEGGK